MAFKDPRLKIKYIPGTKIQDCGTCANCAEPVKAGQPIPPNFPKFCIVEQRYLMRYFSDGKWIIGIKKAETCPNYKRK